MSIYKNKTTSKEAIVCDGCGISEFGTCLDQQEWKKVDFTARMREEGFPEGSALEVKDYCPDCNWRSPQTTGPL